MSAVARALRDAMSRTLHAGWKEPKDRVPLAVRQIRSFLRAHRPAGV